MAALKREKPWHVENPELVAEIQSDLAGSYPALHLYIDGDDAEIRGTYPVRSADGKELEEFQVRIVLPSGYPEELPIVWEVGGRLPWTERHHINADGTCCVFMPDSRWEAFPVGARFGVFLAGPLRDYFLGQSLVQRGEDWPHGEWSHGAKGVWEYYSELLDTRSRPLIRRFLIGLAYPNRKGRIECPCGSRRKLHKCCRDQVLELRKKISPTTARCAISVLGLTVPNRK